jgi:hypothetical protein
MLAMGTRRPVVLLVVALVIACAGGAYVAAADHDDAAVATTTSTSTSTSTSTTLGTTTSTAPSTTATTSSTSGPTTSSTRPHPPRVVTEQAWAAYATVGGLELRLPSDHVEAIGFHESADDGAQEQQPIEGVVRWFTQESRDRDTKDRGAADIVVEPNREVRVPVTGTVKRAGTYTLYCDTVDEYAVIEPDAHPGWEVKVLHIQGLALSKGQRVEAGVTRLAARAHVLPFPSTVEDDTGLPPWPHVHVEVVDPSIPDRPTGPGCD